MTSQPTPSSPSQTRQWAHLSSVAALVTLAAVGIALGVNGWSDHQTRLFTAGATAGFLTVVGVAWRTIPVARRAEGVEPITPATWLTVARGSTLVVLVGFLLIDPPMAELAWVPGLLFAVAAGLDAVDGKLARATDSVSELGGRLDVEMDSLTVLFGTLLAVRYGTVPAAFLLVGLARYAFVAGIHYRRLQGRPVFDLDSSLPRRALGGLAMVTIWLALVPTPGPAVSRVLALIVLVPFVANFLRDWLVVSGRHPVSGSGSE